MLAIFPVETNDLQTAEHFININLVQFMKLLKIHKISEKGNDKLS